MRLECIEVNENILWFWGSTGHDDIFHLKVVKMWSTFCHKLVNSQCESLLCLPKTTEMFHYKIRGVRMSFASPIKFGVISHRFLLHEQRTFQRNYFLLISCWFSFILNVDKLVTFKCLLSSTNYSTPFPKNFGHLSLDFIFKFKEKTKRRNYWLISFSLICPFWNHFANFLNDFIWCPSRAAYHCRMPTYRELPHFISLRWGQKKVQDKIINNDLTLWRFYLSSRHQKLLQFLP